MRMTTSRTRCRRWASRGRTLVTVFALLEPYLGRLAHDKFRDGLFTKTEEACLLAVRCRSCAKQSRAHAHARNILESWLALLSWRRAASSSGFLSYVHDLAHWRGRSGYVVRAMRGSPKCCLRVLLIRGGLIWGMKVTHMLGTEPPVFCPMSSPSAPTSKPHVQNMNFRWL